MDNVLKVALAQIAPVWLDKLATLKKIEATIVAAAKENAELVVFGEALLPGYPFWLALTNGAGWDLKVNMSYTPIMCEMPFKLKPANWMVFVNWQRNTKWPFIWVLLKDQRIGAGIVFIVPWSILTKMGTSNRYTANYSLPMMSD